MSSGNPFDSHGPLDGAHLDAFARQVLQNVQKPEADDSIERAKALSDWLVRETLSQQDFRIEAIREHLIDSQLSQEVVVDLCIPRAARIAGQLWVDDKVSFVEVTLAASKLYGLCKSLSDEWVRHSRASEHLTLVVATVPGEQHMLGSVVLTSQLRRAGHSVQLLSGRTQSELVDCIENGEFDAVLMSCSGSGMLDSATRVMQAVRLKMRQPPRLVVGGAIDVTSENPVTVDGADLTTSDLEIALRGLGCEPVSREMLAAQ